MDGYDRRGRRPDDFAARPRPGGEIPAAGRGRPGSRPAGGFNGLPPDGQLPGLGTMSPVPAALVLVGATMIGVILTLITRKEPGVLLAVCVILGSLAAVLGVRRGAVHLFFPVPALAFFAAAVVTGYVHDRELASSTAGLGAGFTQWVAGIFFPAVAATILVLLVGGGRWLLTNTLVTGGSPRPAGRLVQRDARTAPGSRRPAGDAWADDPSADDSVSRSRTGPPPRPGGGPSRGPVNGSRPGRVPRDPRTDRDPWGDPRLPPDRSQPTGPRPQVSGRPASQPQPRAPRTGQTGPGPSWNPAPQPQRPPRREPPDGWVQR